MTLLTAIGLVVLAWLLAMLGGAATGARLAGQYLGNGLAAMMGAFFGPAAVVPAALLGVALLAWWHYWLSIRNRIKDFNLLLNNNNK